MNGARPITRPGESPAPLGSSRGGAAVFAGLKRIDVPLFFTTWLLLGAGLLALLGTGEEGGARALRQLVWVAAGALVSVPLILVPYQRLVRYAWPLFLLAIGGLLLLRAVGPVINQAQRWFVFGSVSLQPSEFAKLAVVLVIARMGRFGRPLDRAGRVLPLFLVAVLPAALILKQPDLGTALLFGPLLLAGLLVGGFPLRRLLLLILIGAALGGLAFEYGLKDYQRERILATFDWDSMTKTQRFGAAYQLTQSLYRVAAGGAFGTSEEEIAEELRGSLPHDHNDFIFTMVAQNTGFFGALGVLLLGGGLVLCVFRVALRARDPAGRFVAAGIGTLLGAQMLVHAAVTLGLAPTTGMPFPLVSYGGSSLVATLASLALVQNVAVHHRDVMVFPGGRD